MHLSLEDNIRVNKSVHFANNVTIAAIDSLLLRSCQCTSSVSAVIVHAASLLFISFITVFIRCETNVANIWNVGANKIHCTYMVNKHKQ